MYPKPAIYQIKLESGLVTEDDMLSMGYCRVLPLLCPLQTDMAGLSSQQEFPCGSICRVTMGHEPIVDGYPATHHSLQIPHQSYQGASTYEAILSDYPQQSTVFSRCGLSMSPHGLVTPMRPAISLCHMPSWAIASTSYLVHIGFGQDIIRTTENWEQICNLNLPQCEGRIGQITT